MMAKSIPFGSSLDTGSDTIPEHYCEPCNDLKDEIKPIAGHCIDCGENLCVECFNSHLGPKPSRNHKLVDKSAKPPTQQKQQTKSLNAGEICIAHGATIQSFCRSHSVLCCKVCLTMDHTICNIEEISNMARNIKESKELDILYKKLKNIQKGFEENLRKTSLHKLTIQKNFTDAINEMKKLRAEIDTLLNETEKLADKAKEEDFKRIETVSSTSNILIEQINNIRKNLDILKENRKSKRLFISMKRAESQIPSLEDSLDTLDNDNTVREYKVEPVEKLKAVMKDLKVLGQLNFTEQIKKEHQTSKKPGTIATASLCSFKQQMAKYKEPEVINVTFNKVKGSMGLSIVAAKGKGQVDSGIYIKYVVPEGAAAVDGRLEAGDQLLEVDGQSLAGLQQEKAAELMAQTGHTVVLKVAKQGAIYHGLATVLS